MQHDASRSKFTDLKHHKDFLLPTESKLILQTLVGRSVTSVKYDTSASIKTLTQDEDVHLNNMGYGQYIIEFDSDSSMIILGESRLLSLGLLYINAPISSDLVKSNLELFSTRSRRFLTGESLDLTNRFSFIGRTIKNVKFYRSEKSKRQISGDCPWHLRECILCLQFGAIDDVLFSYCADRFTGNYFNLSIEGWENIDVDSNQSIAQVWSAENFELQLR